MIFYIWSDFYHFGLRRGLISYSLFNILSLSRVSMKPKLGFRSFSLKNQEKMKQTPHCAVNKDSQYQEE